MRMAIDSMARDERTVLRVHHLQCDCTEQQLGRVHVELRRAAPVVSDVQRVQEQRAVRRAAA